MSCENDNALIAIIKSINQEVKKRIPNANEKMMCKKEKWTLQLFSYKCYKITIKFLIN